ncbi:RNA polymerase sigma factor [bacterium]|nr:MAG: RNA polymerase sigma factor [bacterium]
MQNEQDILIACKKGKKAAQEALYKLYFGFGMSVSLRYAPQREDAIEILHDSFIKVFSKLDTYDFEKPFKSWFRKIIVNTALDYYRVRKKHLHLAELDDLDYESETDDIWDSTPLQSDTILKLFQQLPEDWRYVFNMYEVEGYSHDEIAGLMGISPGTSRSHLSRAKSKLKKLYSESIKKEIS